MQPCQIGVVVMIETVVSVNLMVGEVLKIKKNHLAPDFPNGNEKRICLVSGIYGDELQGQYICYEVIRRIKKEYHNLTGIVDVYPTLNPLGMAAKIREIPGSQIDMNELFPGSQSGAMGEYAAYNILQDILGADFCIDIHASNLYLHEIPQVRMNDDVEDILMPYAKLFNADMIWVHPSTQVRDGSLAYELNKRGVKCFVTESGFAYKINQDYGNQLVDGIFAIMKYMGIWQGDVPEIKNSIIAHDNDIIYINSESSGIFIPRVKMFDRVNKGDELGYVVNVITGSVEESIKAPVTGTICALREYPATEEGSLLARIVVGGESDE